MPAVLYTPRSRTWSDDLRLGIVNNMPDKALLSTARQFLSVIDLAAPDFRVFVSLFSLPGIDRSEAGKRHLIDNSYRSLADIQDANLDAIIVTGTEPRQQDLKDEPYWRVLSSLFDWIDRDGPSALFSCLAAHAAVLHFDGIERRRLERKCFGLFDHATTSHDELTEQLPLSFKIAHSRWNEIPEDALGEKGYRILTESSEAGADLFVKERRNLMVFFQGHPEYDASTLGREYQRDVRRFIGHEREDYPNVPSGYFNLSEKELLDRFRARAIQSRDENLMDRFPVLANRFPHPQGKSVAAAVFRSWLLKIMEAKKPVRREQPLLQQAGA
jgi:homoserine O-succinyltransferase/O-acetyltransferase